MIESLNSNSKFKVHLGLGTIKMSPFITCSTGECVSPGIGASLELSECEASVVGGTPNSDIPESKMVTLQFNSIKSIDTLINSLIHLKTML